MSDTTTAISPTTGLDRETKQKIRTWVLRLRHLLQDDIRAQLRRFGIEAGKSIANSAPDYLTDDEKRSRQVIVAAIQRDAVNERSTTDAITAYVRESAYTFLNRMVGLKCMEERGILFVDDEQNEVVTTRTEYGERSRLLWTMREEDRAYRQDETRLWREGLVRAFRAVTVDIALLFDPESEWSQVWPTQKTLMDAIRAINSLDSDSNRAGQSSVFASPDFLGWIYQFFNVEEKEQIRDDTGGKPRTSHELAVINQFYTPDWIVKFLVDNTLGRVWLRMHPDTNLRNCINYIVPNTGEDEPIPLKPAGELKLLDPACGTMHMGQYAFGLLYEMYLEEQARSGQVGWPSHPSVKLPSEIPAAILSNNLYGIDIDPRAIQIAALALLLTLKEQARDHGLDPRLVHVERMNLVCADAVNLGEEQMEEFVASLDPAIFGGTEPLRRAVRTVWLGLKHVAELGSLVQVGEEVERALQMPVNYRIRAFGPGQETLDAGEDWGVSQRRLTVEERTTAGQQLEQALAEYARQHTAAEDVNRRLFAQETDKAVHLLDLLRQRYDTIVMNPPYGDPTESAKTVLRRQNPQNWTDNYSVFVERAISLVHVGSGYVGALTSRTFLHLSSFEYIRKQYMVGQSGIRILLDLGGGVLDGATVETAAYVLQRTPSIPTITFVRLDDTPDKNGKFEDVLMGGCQSAVYSVLPAALRRLPTAMLAYSMPTALSEAFTLLRPLAESVSFKQGMATGDDERFIRYRWEIVTGGISPAPHWKLFAKGGEYSPYYRDFDLYVNWTSDGAAIKATEKGAFGRGATHYFITGLTWSSTSSVGLNVQFWPGGVFSKKGMAGFPLGRGNIWTYIALLNSHLGCVFADAINPGRDYQAGHLNAIPAPRFDAQWDSRMAGLSKSMHDNKQAWDRGNELASVFVSPWLILSTAKSPQIRTLDELLTRCNEWEQEYDAECRRLQSDIDNATYAIYGVSTQDCSIIEREIGKRPHETVWPQMEGRSNSQKCQEHVLRLLSYFVKTAVEQDGDGIVPLAQCSGEPTLIDQVRSSLDVHFGAERANDIESEINSTIGRKTNIETWLSRQYFKYHIQLYKKRPIFWHIASEDGGFGVIVHYHRFTYDRLQKLRNVYLHGFILRLQGEIGRLRGDASVEARVKVATWEQNLESARALDDKLREIQEGEIPINVPWKSAADQPKGWRPNIDDGVKVNIGPFEAAGVLAVKKVV